MSKETNKEGLTWREWYNAAVAWGTPVNPKTGVPFSLGVLMGEWKKGADPTDFAACTVDTMTSEEQ